ncbi:MAG: CDP-diacylglycerol--glycerol-3-phosphate 3-phosphatidyltransferase [Candidatus Saccharicenans subterraneus]|uniref:CDP-diacylglycerol--glycerol-3-phosphate 3-phosphatidyltransferase n=1 Tax=Candidatus Saccharicenans subterraneus TaxID=2508984 RepID=A0A3E2BL37_9BACT|nr:MAG: CDP-diacylglycerol--glycerol-3-phosphate 3-phosphatidyltransferase [Candidatus Saccharicenans subterraneum]
MVSYENKGFRLLPKKLIVFILEVFDRFSLFLVRLKLSPNLLSFLGLLAGLLVGLFFALGRWGWALVFLVICGMLDILDGKVATNSNRRTVFGAVFDSSLDRYSEFAIYLGLGFYFGPHWVLWVLALAFLGSTMVSYTKARAESLGVSCQLGIMQRAERMVLLIIGTLLALIIGHRDTVMIAVIIILAVVSNLTAIQRIAHVYRVEKKKATPRD